MRERLAEHRANPACSGCHQLMDPVGFSLENYDAVGRWRTVEDGKPIDAAGGLPDGTKFDRRGRAAEGIAQPPGEFRHHFHRKASYLCAWAAASSTTMRRQSAKSCGRRGIAISGSRHSFWVS